MNFDIFRTSRNKIPGLKSVGNERDCVYNIEISSIQQLVELVKQVDCSVIIKRVDDTCCNLEIYDDFRE